MILDVGCGETKQKGSIGFDIRPLKGKVDVAGDVLHLPFRNKAFDSLHASDVLEHLVTKETPELLSEWARVLKRGGHIYIKTPDMRALSYAYLKGVIPVQEFSRKIYGGGSLNGDAWNLHKTGNDASSLCALLQSAGFGSINVEQGTSYDWSNVICQATKL